MTPHGDRPAKTSRPGDTVHASVARLDAEESLRDIQSITQASLAHLHPNELLNFLLDRILALVHCDTSAVLLLDKSSNQLVATVARGLEEEVRQGVRIPLGVGFAGRVASERRPVVLDRVEPSTVANPILWEKGIRSMLGVPLIASGALLGVLHVGSFSDRSFAPSEVMLLELVADKVAAATQASIAEAERRASSVLQRSLLPGALPNNSNFEFASRYVPAERGDIGGDWYDAFEVPSGDVWIVAGDVVGHGLQPAVVMGRLKSTIQAYAVLGMSPSDVLRAANKKLQLFDPGAMATAVCGVFAPPYDELRVCSAGHLPPVIARPGEDAIILDVPPGPPLGVVADFEMQPIRYTLVDGSVVVFYTDGLVERRGKLLSDGIELLRTEVKPEHPHSLCVRIMDALIGRYVPADDVALIALRVVSQSNHTESIQPDAKTNAIMRSDIMRSEVFPCQPESVKASRRFVAECVEYLGLRRMPEVQLMVSELATNAVVHAHTQFDIIIERLSGGEVRVEIRDFGVGSPQHLKNDLWSDYGRGLRIVDALAERWAVEERPSGQGKSIWFIVSG